MVGSEFDNSTNNYALDFDAYAFFDPAEPAPSETEVFFSMSNEELFLLFITNYIFESKDIFNQTQSVAFGRREE